MTHPVLESLKLRLSESQCELCGASEAELLYKKLPYVFRCSGCSLVFAYPQPTPSQLQDFYDQQYFMSESSAMKGYDNYLKDERNVRRTFERRLHSIHRFVRHGRLIDIGCATGFFLLAAKAKGWETQGVEISDFAADYARKLGLEVFAGTLDTFPMPEKPFDLATLWDVLEHFPSPRQALEKTNQLLRKGGFLVLTTPDINSWSRLLFKEKWMGFKEHEHLYFFSLETLRQLLLECGFAIRYTKFAGKYVSFDLFKRRVGCYSKSFSNFLRKAFPLRAEALNFYINPFDIRFAVAQKVAEID